MGLADFKTLLDVLESLFLSLEPGTADVEAVYCVFIHRHDLLLLHKILLHFRHAGDSAVRDVFRTREAQQFPMKKLLHFRLALHLVEEHGLDRRGWRRMGTAHIAKLLQFGDAVLAGLLAGSRGRSRCHVCCVDAVR